MTEMEFAQAERAVLIKRIDNVKRNRRRGVITRDECDGKVAELQAALDYVEVQIAAFNSGDGFDYAAAAEHLKDIRDDISLCIEHWGFVHGLTPAQCEQIYIAAHIDRNSDEELDRNLIDALIVYFKRINAAA